MKHLDIPAAYEIIRLSTKLYGIVVRKMKMMKKK
jgi:hypothetical protein